VRVERKGVFEEIEGVVKHTRRRLYVLRLGGICEEIDAGWDTRRRMYVWWVGDVCEEIELGVLRVS